MKGRLYRSLERVIQDIAIRNPLEPAEEDADSRRMIGDHVEKHLGAPEMVIHEIHPAIVHIDILVVGPRPGSDFQTLVTSGMSNKPMVAPAEAYAGRFIELMMFLPPSWLLSEEALKDERYFWPLRWMQTLARMPHTRETWLGPERAIGNGCPPKPFASNTELCASMFSSLHVDYKRFSTLRVDEHKTIHFLEIIPIYREELDFARKYDPEALLETLFCFGEEHVVDISRNNVCRRYRRRPRQRLSSKVPPHPERAAALEKRRLMEARRKEILLSAMSELMKRYSFPGRCGRDLRSPRQDDSSPPGACHPECSP